MKTGPARRAPWGSISRQRIVEAAMNEVRAGRYAEMTIRGLAGGLGVSPMSLYRHVRDKDDLLDEVVDRLLEGTWRPSSDPDDWRSWVAEAADTLRRLLVDQPAALHVYLSHPVVSPAAIARMNAMMGVLRPVVGDEEAAGHAYAAIHTYTIGFAALEASRAAWRPTDGADDTARQLATYATAPQFAVSLHYLLDGIVTGSGTPSHGEAREPAAVEPPGAGGRPTGARTRPPPPPAALHGRRTGGDGATKPEAS